MNRQDACSTRKFTLCGTGKMPVLENGARCDIHSGCIGMIKPQRTQRIQRKGRER
jgi:hypothetical protein